MKLTGDLKKKVDAAESRDEAKRTIEDAGMLLTDDELERVAGGYCGETIPTIFGGESDHICPNCGASKIFASDRGWYCPTCEKEP